MANRKLAWVAGGIVAILVVVLVADYVLDPRGGPIGTLLATDTPAPPPPQTGKTEVRVVSSAQGAQDEATNDTPQGPDIDIKRCINRMIIRKLTPVEAKTVCTKIIDGITR